MKVGCVDSGWLVPPVRIAATAVPPLHLTSHVLSSCWCRQHLPCSTYIYFPIEKKKMATAQRIPGKACIVTGAGGGIGAATCKRFAAEGAIGVVCVDLNLDAAKEVADAINEEFGAGKAIALVR